MKLPLVVWLAIAIASASAVSAQSRAESAPVPPTDAHGLKIPVIVWTAGVVVDQITTYRFSSQYGDLLHEENPLIRGFDRHPVLLVAVGTAIDAATGWASYRFIGRRHPRLAKVAFYGAAAYRAYLAVHNVQMMRRTEQVRGMASAYATTSP